MSDDFLRFMGRGRRTAAIRPARSARLSDRPRRTGVATAARRAADNPRRTRWTDRP